MRDFLDSLPMQRYAERGDDLSFWAEPLNAFTGLLFIVAAAVALRDLRRRELRDAGITALIVLGMIHGAGSFLYHSARSPVTLVFDFTPMVSFVALTIVLILQRLSKSWWTALALLAALIAAQVLLALLVPRDFLNGSHRHGFTVLALVGLVAWIRASDYRRCWRLAAAAIALYAVAVVFRSIDVAVEDSFRWGTHFLWHSINALASYLAMRLLMAMR